MGTVVVRSGITTARYARWVARGSLRIVCVRVAVMCLLPATCPERAGPRRVS